MQTNIKIIFPPQFEPFQPYLSLPYLKALLYKYGFNSKCFDANLEFYWWLYSKINNKEIPPHCRNDYLISNVSKAIDIIRSMPEKIEEYRWAINVLDEYLSEISPANVKISLNSISIGNKYDSSGLIDFLNNDNNIFKAFFADLEEEFLDNPRTNTFFFSIVVLDQLAAAMTFAREIRLRQPAAKIIIGGPLISHIYDRLVRLPIVKNLFDYITPKEGHLAIRDIFNLNYSYNGHITPDFSDLHLDRYFSPQLVLPYLMAHGCRWGRCSFCSHHLSYHQFRESNISEVVSDISQLHKKYGAKYISFSDEYLSVYQLEQISNHILNNSLKIRWSTFVRAEPRFTDNDFTKKLYDAGCRLLMFGFESASQRILNSMKKGTQVKYYPAILQSCKTANIAVRLDFMLGFPDESEKDVRKTFSFIKNYKDLIDTPFSSYSIAVFELREGAPIINELKNHKIRLIAPLRGSLDNQFEFIDKTGISFQQKKEWREKLIAYFKNEFNADLITPHNKTHQLIMKDFYDERCIDFPITKILPENIYRISGKWSSGIVIINGHKYISIINHSTGGKLLISKKLSKIAEAFMINSNLAAIYRCQKELDLLTFVKLINFLLRNDYINICFEERKDISIVGEENQDFRVATSL